jgi:hypothetical protein
VVRCEETYVRYSTGGFGQSSFDSGEVVAGGVGWGDVGILEPLVGRILELGSHHSFDIVDNA